MTKGQIVPESTVIAWADAAARLATFLRGSTVSTKMLEAAKSYTRATLELLTELEALTDGIEQEQRALEQEQARPDLRLVTP